MDLLTQSPNRERPFKRVIRLRVDDNLRGKTCEVVHEVAPNSDERELKKDLQAKLAVLLEALYK